MDDLPQDEIAQIGRAIVADIAPKELILFRMQSEDFFRDPKKAITASKRKEDAAGWGAADLVHAVTPFVLAALTEVVRALGKEIGQELGIQARNPIRSIVRWILEKKADDALYLTAEQLQRVRAIALANGGTNPVIAQQIADAIVANLSADKVLKPRRA